MVSEYHSSLEGGGGAGVCVGEGRYERGEEGGRQIVGHHVCLISLFIPLYT